MTEFSGRLNTIRTRINNLSFQSAAESRFLALHPEDRAGRETVMRRTNAARDEVREAIDSLEASLKEHQL